MSNRMNTVKYNFCLHFIWRVLQNWVKIVCLKMLCNITLVGGFKPTHLMFWHFHWNLIKQTREFIKFVISKFIKKRFISNISKKIKKNKMFKI